MQEVLTPLGVILPGEQVADGGARGQLDILVERGEIPVRLGDAEQRPIKVHRSRVIHLTRGLERLARELLRHLVLALRVVDIRQAAARARVLLAALLAARHLAQILFQVLDALLHSAHSCKKRQISRSD
jgi:hypothetical protein